MGRSRFLLSRSSTVATEQRRPYRQRRAGAGAEAGEAGTSDTRPFARHEPPQPDAAGGHKRPSAEAAGRQHLPAGFRPATWPERTTGSRRDAATRGRR
ncbi:hypothetical protein CRZ11_22065 [Salmonella enterica]|nr:hypothetical protein [Salmonella enterica]EFT8085243.1 hypothetical protein [Salmonella enterica]EFT8117965.1 hypothetical protein [Salmonella enterica]EKC6457424.1 hypothetical protein [Salmonella enterica]